MMMTTCLIAVSWIVLIIGCNSDTFTPHWNTTIPDLAINSSGGIQLIDCKHYTIYNATLSDGISANPMGTFNHGPQIIYYKNRFYASWYNSLQNENDIFMRVLYSTSIDGIHWNKAQILFPNITDNGSYSEPFIILNNRLYGSCSLWTNNNDGVVAQMRLINNPNDLGSIFWLSDHVPAGFNTFGYHTYHSMSVQIQNDMLMYLASLIAEDINITSNNNPTVRFNQTRSMYLIPNHNIYNNDLQIILLIRDGSGSTKKEWSSSCKIPISSLNHTININETLQNIHSCRAGDYFYVNLVAIFNEKNNMSIQCVWSEPIITNIPDAPSRSCSGSLHDGSIYLLGNQEINSNISFGGGELNRNVLTLGIAKDGLSFNNVYAIRADPPRIMFPSNTKSIEFGYPSAVWNDHYLYVIYDVNKEDIALSIVNLNDI